MTNTRVPLCAAALALLLWATAAGAGGSLADRAEQKEWQAVADLLGDGVAPAAAQPDGMTALHWAVLHGDAPTVRRLIAAGADANAATRYGVRPLAIACQNGDADAVRMLLSAGADANATQSGGETALMTACRTGDGPVVSLMLESRADPNAIEASGQTALMWAASAGATNAIDLMIKHGADLHATSRQGFTALGFASRDGRLKAAARLLEAGADVNAAMRPQDRDERAPRKGMSPLLLAVESGHFELALLLVRQGADPDDQRSGYTPLHAVSWVRKANLGDNPSGDPEPRGSGGVTSLQFVRELVAAGADVNRRIEGNKGGAKQLRHDGCSPLLFAARTADLPLVRLLVDLGADPTIPNRDGCTPLMACAGVGVQGVGEEAGAEPEVLETLDYLLALGAEVNTIDDNRETAMHGAAYRNFPRVVELLAKHDADPQRWNHKNKSGWTPMRIAEGHRPGSFKPHPPTQAALRAALGAPPP